VETDEVLETGYGDATPSGDNLLNDFARGEYHAFASLARARGDAVLDDAEFQMVMTDRGSPSPFGNAVVMRRPLRDDEWPSAAAKMHEFYDARPGGPFIVFSAWSTVDLRQMRFGLIGHPPMMFRLPSPIAIPKINGFEIKRVIDGAGARDWEYVMVHGYPVPELQPLTAGSFLPEVALAAEDWHHLVGYLEGVPVATGSGFVHDECIHVEFISALESARGRGIGAAITIAATNIDTSLPAMLISSYLGRPVYDRLGYRSLSRFTLWAGNRQA
jgi:hypothetical protein